MILSNVLFLIFTTYCFYQAFKSIVTYKSCSIVDYVIAIIYVFNCLPVLLDLCIGIPDYFIWYESLETAMRHTNTCHIYNIYIAISFIILISYKKSKDKTRNWYELKLSSDLVNRYKKNNIFLYFIIILPFIYVISQYGLNVFTQYASLTTRGVEDSGFVNFLLMLSSFFAITIFLKNPKKTYIHIILLVVYLFLVIYLNGKRYIVTTLLIMLLFYYEQQSHNSRKRINLKLVYFVIAIGLILFSLFYFAIVRVGHSANENMYAMLRIDFGRDDVTKFVIYREFIKNDPILDYPCQSVLSTIFAWVPRVFWPTKPYPHYRYLTAAIIDADIHDKFAGVTPSLYEMSIANFGFLGFLLTPLVLIFLCRWADKSANIEVKLLYLLIIINLLTQAIDTALTFVLLLILYSIYALVSHKRAYNHSMRNL